MEIIPLIVAAAAPGLALMAYFYLKDRYVPEPIPMVGKVFLIGVLLVFPTMVIQRGFYLWLGISESAAGELLTAFVLSAAVEEFVKWFILYFYIFKHKVFDEPYNGIVYATAVSLGFATLENVMYALAFSMDALVLFLRALLPVSAHALFAVIMGHYFGKARFSPESERKYLALALGLPVLWHGVYDYLVIKMDELRVWLVIPLMALLWVRGIRHINKANERSPYRSVSMGDQANGSG